MEPFSLTPHVRPDLDKLVEKLSTQVSQMRLSRLESRLKQRLRSVVCVFENTHHSHNISAVLRTVDALGFLESVFVYDQKNMRFRQKDNVERGASQWLLTRRTDNIELTAQHLRKQGYVIALVSLPSFATTSSSYVQHIPQFSASAVSSEDFLRFVTRKRSNNAGESITKPLALVFGSELQGVAPSWTKHADCYLCVEMRGFVESLNVSVCAGILLHSLREFYVKHGSPILPESDECRLIRAYWLTRAARSAQPCVQASCPELLDLYNFIKRGQFYNPFDNDHWRQL